MRYVLALVLVACTVEASVEARPAPPKLAECESTHESACRSIWPEATYGTLPSCTGAPWRETEAGTAFAARDGGCIETNPGRDDALLCCR